MNLYCTITELGERTWHADDAAHAREQHELAYSGEADEQIVGIVALGPCRDSECPCNDR